MEEGIKNLFNGIVLITGEHGTGKTSASLEYGDLSRTAFVDHDVKGRQTYQQMKDDDLEVAMYRDMIHLTEGKKSLMVHDAGKKVIEELLAAKNIDTLVWDNWTPFADSCVAYVQTYPQEFKDEWAAMGKIRKGEEYKEARLYEAAILAKLQKHIPTVIITSHTKAQYRNNAATGKSIPAVSKAIDRICLSRIWLRHNPMHTTPIALVLKNVDKKVKGPRGRVRTVQMLPKKLTPLEKDLSIWDVIERYYKEPIGTRKPTPDETPDDFEMSIIEGTLTADQKVTWLYAMQSADREREEEEILRFEENRDKVLELKSEGLSLGEISKQVDLAIKDVLAIIKEAK